MTFTPVVVTRRYLTAELTPASGRVIFTPQVPMVNGDTVIAAPRTGELDAEGDLHLAVAATTDPATVPPAVSYLVREEIDKQRAREYYVQIPHDAAGGTVDLSTLTVATVPPAVTYPAVGPAGPQGEQGPQGDPGLDLIGSATDLDATGAAVGQVVKVSATVPSLGFALDAVTYADLSGTVPTSALPPLAINSVDVVADEVAMLALTAERGDMAIREDNGLTYVLASDSPGTLADWIEVLAAGQVASVAGKTGVVLLAKADVGLGNVDNTSDAGKPVSTATQTALDAKVSASLIDAKGDLLAGTAADTVARVAAGAADGLVLTVSASQAAGMRWHANPTVAPVTLVDGAAVALDATAGKVFRLTAAGDRTISIPTNPASGRGIIIAHTASGGARTLALTTGSSGAFAFGSDITALSATGSGLTDYIGCIYDSTAARWRVISYVKGY